MYFAGSQGEEFDKTMLDMGCARLFSQLNDRKQILKHLDLLKDKDNKLFIDSGAFSAKNSGKHVDLDSYIAYINEIGERVTCFANLDIIPNSSDMVELARCAELGFNNFMTIQKECKYANKCMAVFHKGDPVEILYRYIYYYQQNPRLNFISLGGIAGADPSTATEFAAKYCDIIKQHLPNVKIHLFGYTRLNDLHYINCDSVDSTTWIKASIYGTIITPWGRLNISDRRLAEKGSVHNYDHKSKAAVYDFVKTLGFDMSELKVNPSKRIEYNVKYLLNWCERYKYTPMKHRKKALI